MSIFEDRRLRSHVRVWDDRRPVGSAFVLGPRHVMTCAHVVGDSAGMRAALRDVAEAPRFEVRLDMPIAPGRMFRARPVESLWRPESSDPAASGLTDAVVLELCEDSVLPEGYRPVGKTRRVREDDPIRGYGVSLQQPTGIVIRGLYQDLVALNRFHIRAEAIDEAIRPGCSGAAAWNSASPGVAGMVVEMQQTTIGRVIPVDVLEEIWAIPWEEPEGPPPRRTSATALRRAPVIPRLKEELRSFDRQVQIGRFEGLLTEQWDRGRKPLVCTIAGLEPDKPDWCRDKCRHVGLDRRFEKLRIRADRVNMIPLSWPEAGAFDHALAFSGLLNEVRAHLDPRNDSAAAFRQAYNSMLNPVVFYSDVAESAVRAGEEAHVALLRDWIDFWAQVGDRPLKKPFVHFLLLTLDPLPGGVEAELEAYYDFYQRLLAGIGADQKHSLPLLGFCDHGELDVWLQNVARDLRLGKSQLALLRDQAEEMFRRNPKPRMADVAKWLEELNV